MLKWIIVDYLKKIIIKKGVAQMATFPLDFTDILKTMLWGVHSKPDPIKSLEERRILCFKKLLENQEQSVLARKKNLNDIGYFQKEYRELYTKCEKDLRP